MGGFFFFFEEGKLNIIWIIKNDRGNSPHAHTHTHTQPLCLDRWRRTEGGRCREGRLVLIAVNHAVRWEDRGGRRTAVNFDPLPGRRDAGVCVCVWLCVCVCV